MNDVKLSYTQRLVLRFVKWVCPPDLNETIEGDLVEQFEIDLLELGLKKARRRSLWNAIKFVRPGIILRNKISVELNEMSMLKSYFVIAVRNLFKRRLYSLINVFGLALGMAAFFLIVHYVDFERGYEDVHKNRNNIYRVTLDIYKGPEFVVADCGMYSPIGPLLKKQLPGVIDFVRLFPAGIQEVGAAARKFREDKIYLADPSFLNIFSLEIIHGGLKVPFSSPFEAIITTSMAIKYFGRTDAVGEMLEIAKKQFKVIAIVKDAPANSHLKFDFLLSHSTLAKVFDWYDENNYGMGNSEYTYLLTDSSITLEGLNESLKKLSIKLLENIGDDILVAQPLKDIHLYSNKLAELEPNGSARSVNFLLIIALFIVIIAWVNYVTISTARSAERSREVGVRRIMGSLRKQLIFQFLVESFLITLLSGVLSLFILFLSLPWFISLTGQQLPPNIFGSSIFWYLFVGVLFTGSLLSGFYPAFILSSFDPTKVLKGKLYSSTHGQWLRRGLVVFQFAITIGLIICVWTVYSEIDYLQKYNLGMNLEQTLVLRAPEVENDSTYRVKYESLRNELAANSTIKMASRSQSLPGLGLADVATTGNIFKLGEQKSQKGTLYYIYSIDENFIPMLKMELVAGRNFQSENSSEQQLIVNEEAIRLLGFRSAEDAVGSKLKFFGDEKTIIGVLKNFHQQSPKEKHLPMLFSKTTGGNYISLKVNSSDVQSTIETVEVKWKEMFPDSPFDYFLLDEKYNQQYRADQHFARVIAVFSELAVFIACLGLFGLSYFTIALRTQEIGIRKVLGASVFQIINLLSRDFTKLVLLAGIIALPVAYIAMEEWLSNYEVKVKLSAVVFVLSLLSVVVLSLATVGFQTIKSAIANPVDSLRDE